jgi:predicted NUDIX family NTP pyrophosphohydrolase
MGNISAGLLMAKQINARLCFLLVHPGGPFFRNKDLGSWTIPKGLVEAGEDILGTAIREFQEETGIIPSTPYHALGQIKQKGGKIVYAWAFRLSDAYLNWDPENLVSNTFELEWPPRSGKFQHFPEIDQAGWFDFDQATRKINAAQVPFLEKAEALDWG